MISSREGGGGMEGEAERREANERRKISALFFLVFAQRFPSSYPFLNHHDHKIQMGQTREGVNLALEEKKKDPGRKGRGREALPAWWWWRGWWYTSYADKAIPPPPPAQLIRGW